MKILLHSKPDVWGIVPDSGILRAQIDLKRSNVLILLDWYFEFAPLESVRRGSKPVPEWQLNFKSSDTLDSKLESLKFCQNFLNNSMNFGTVCSWCRIGLYWSCKELKNLKELLSKKTMHLQTKIKEKQKRRFLFWTSLPCLWLTIAFLSEKRFASRECSLKIRSKLFKNKNFWLNCSQQIAFKSPIKSRMKLRAFETMFASWAVGPTHCQNRSASWRMIRMMILREEPAGCSFNGNALYIRFGQNFGIGGFQPDEILKSPKNLTNLRQHSQTMFGELHWVRTAHWEAWTVFTKNLTEELFSCLANWNARAQPITSTGSKRISGRNQGTSSKWEVLTEKFSLRKFFREAGERFQNI